MPTNPKIHDGYIDFLNNNDASVLKLSSNGAFGASGDTIGFYGVTPAARPSALVQTYATAGLTHSALTATSAATTAPTGTSPKGFTTTAQAGAVFRGVNALIVDVTNVKKVLNKVIDQLQSNGLLQ